MNLALALSFCMKKTNPSTYLTAGGSGNDSVCPCFISNYSYTKKCMRVGVKRKQTLLVTTELALWGYNNAFLFTNQSEVDFGIALV
jgi:hypothetical protein